MEARVGIEPTHKGFADLSLTTWVPRLNLSIIAKTRLARKHRVPLGRAAWRGSGLSIVLRGVSERISTCRIVYATGEEDHLMPNALADFGDRDVEARWQRIRGSRDLRPGTITAVTSGRCGKPACHCRQPRSAWTRPAISASPTSRESGKTVSEALPNPSGAPQAEREVAEFHRNFQQLTRETWAASTRRSADSRPLGAKQQRRVAGPSRKKTARSDPAGDRARNKPAAAGRVSSATPQHGRRLDLEATESALRAQLSTGPALPR